MHKYHELLIKRLLFNFTENSAHDKTKNFNNHIENESVVLDILMKYFGSKELYKSRKVISDILLSHKNNQEFNISKLSVITTSFNNWDINQNLGEK